MRPPDDRWRIWGYFAGYLLAGPSMLAFVVWIIWPIRAACPRGHERLCLEISERAIIGGLGLAGLVILGLVVRNTIRNLRAQGPGGWSIDATSHEEGKKDDADA